MTRKASAVGRPTAVRIFGREYAIRYVPQSPLTNTNIGLCVNSQGVIFVEDGQSPYEEADTVLHEILHAVVFNMKLGLDPETEEQVVGALSSGLIGVFQDNPDLPLWLAEDKHA